MTTDSSPAAAQSGSDAGASATPPQGAAGSQPQQPNNSISTNVIREGAEPPVSTKEPAKGAEPAKADEGTPPAFKIPDAFKDKPWASKIKSEEDLYKQIDTLDALKGKKTVVPDFTKVSPAEAEEYFKQTRPESVDAYQFNETTQPEIKKVLGDSLFKYGVTPYQANAVIKEFQAAEAQSVAQLYTADGMKAELTKAFGDQWKEIGGQTKAILAENLTPEDNAMLNQMPNQFLALVYRAANSLTKAYGIKESGAHTDASSGKNQPADINKIRDGYRADIKALSGKIHTAQEKQALIQKLNDTYKTGTK